MSLLSIKELTISCAPTPFALAPILSLFNFFDFVPTSTYEGISYALINPYDEYVRNIRNLSHLTHGQDEETQLRFQGMHETERKLRHLSKCISPFLLNKKILFEFHVNSRIHEMVFYFIKCLKINTNVQIEINFSIQTSQINLSGIYIELDKLYYSTFDIIEKSANKIISTAKFFGKVGDYNTALNFLKRLENVELTDSTREEILNYIGICYRSIGSAQNAESYYKYVFSNTKNIFNRMNAGYALAMIYVSEHNKTFCSLEVAENYLEKVHKELLLDQKVDKEIKEISLVFNRNGYALILFRTGRIKKALRLVEQGIEQLEQVEAHFGKFHQSVLYWNAFQCYSKMKEFKRAEEIMSILLIKDPQYHHYHIGLIEMYLHNGMINKAEKAAKYAIQCTFNFYYINHLLGKIYFIKENYDLALSAFEKSIELNPFYNESFAYASNSAIQLEKYEYAYSLLKNFNLKYDNSPTGETIFNNQIVAILNHSEDIDELKNIFKNAQNIRPSAPILKNIEFE